MIPVIPTATYRVQLREGMDFATLTTHLDQIAGLGVSHLYLAPIFAATEGSTHGYDIIDPTLIDPALGGREGFDRLVAQTHQRGLGIILDIVPNHTAFSVQNPWLADVLKHGQDSDRAPHFDIDWQAGPLVLPWLPEPFEKMLAEGAFTVRDGQWQMEGMSLPLAPGTADGDDLRAIHEAQHWRLVHHALERDGITHRRFFNVTDLIGMRVEEEAVFDDTHTLILDLVRSGAVQGLRVDHIDGLSDPAGYLDRLANALPDTPIWIEKILTGDEALRDGWKTVGTTGYEAGRLITRMLTPERGLADLDAAWRQATGVTQDFHPVLLEAKAEVLDNELAAERRQLARMAGLALAGSDQIEPGPETLREAVTALLIAMPCYRSYVTAQGAGEQDRAMIAEVADQAARGLRDDSALRLLAQIWADPQGPAQVAFVVRLQQVSGALLAKAQEDTAGFRWTRYLPANEVGAEPDQTTITGDEATRVMAGRRAGDMVLTSSHDSKRSEDARARLIATSHFPQDLAALDKAAADMAQAADVPPTWRWYAVQSAIALHGAPDAADRMAQHVQKAMREGKEFTFWSNPDEEVEGRVSDLACALMTAWDKEPPEELTRILQRGEALMLAQLLFKMTMPGFPDIYQGTRDLFVALTDPDNRRPPDWDSLAEASGRDDVGGVKADWTQTLLALRREKADFFRTAEAQVAIDADGIRLTRSLDGRRMVARLELPGHAARADGSAAIVDWTGPDGCRVSLTEGSRD